MSQSPYQYQQFSSEPSFNEQPYSQQQPQQQPLQTNIQMQVMSGEYPQNQQIQSYPQGLPITNYPIQGQMISQIPQNQQQIMQHVMVIPIKSGIQKLSEIQEVFEAITGFETENQYKIFQADQNGIQIGENPIFICKEKSSCCQRQFLSGSMREFEMEVKNENGKIQNGQLGSTVFLKLDRPFKCTCFCYKRPELSVSFVENGSSVFFGKIKNPFWCGELGCEVEDHNGNLKYVINGSCCQLGCICRGFPCKSCQEFQFDIRSPTGEVITRLQKQSPGCLKATISNCDNFALGFPINSTPEEKALLLASALFLDYMYFENKKNGGTNRNNLIRISM